MASEASYREDDCKAAKLKSENALQHKSFTLIDFSNPKIPAQDAEQRVGSAIEFCDQSEQRTISVACHSRWRGGFFHALQMASRYQL